MVRIFRAPWCMVNKLQRGERASGAHNLKWASAKKGTPGVVKTIRDLHPEGWENLKANTNEHHGRKKESAPRRFARCEEAVVLVHCLLWVE